MAPPDRIRTGDAGTPDRRVSTTGRRRTFHRGIVLVIGRPHRDDRRNFQTLRRRRWTWQRAVDLGAGAAAPRALRVGRAAARAVRSPVDRDRDHARAARASEPARSRGAARARRRHGSGSGSGRALARPLGARRRTAARVPRRALAADPRRVKHERLALDRWLHLAGQAPRGRQEGRPGSRRQQEARKAATKTASTAAQMADSAGLSGKTVAEEVRTALRKQYMVLLRIYWLQITYCSWTR